MKTYTPGDEVIIPERRSIRLYLRDCHGKIGTVKRAVILAGFPIVYYVEMDDREFEVFPGELQLKPGPKKERSE